MNKNKYISIFMLLFSLIIYTFFYNQLNNVVVLNVFALGNFLMMVTFNSPREKIKVPSILFFLSLVIITILSYIYLGKYDLRLLVIAFNLLFFLRFSWFFKKAYEKFVLEKI